MSENLKLGKNSRGLYPEEVQALIQAPHKFRKKTPRAIEKADVHQLVILLLWDTWARETELCHIRIEDIDLPNRIITLQHTKKKVMSRQDGEITTERIPRQVTFSEEAARLIERVIAHRGRCGYLFTGQRGKRLSSRSVRALIGRYARLTDIQKITGREKGGRSRYLVHPHAIREAGEAYAVLMGGMNRRTAARKAGHSTATQERYYLKYDIIRQRMEADKAHQELQAKFGSII